MYGIVVLFIAVPALGAESIADLLAAKRFAEVLRAVDPQLKTNPADPRLWTVRGIALSGMKRVDEGLADFDRALKIQPSFLPALKAASETAYAARNSRAGGYLKKLLAIDPASEPAHAMAAVLDFEARDCRSALTHFQASLRQVDASEVAAAQFGHCLLEVGQADEALRIFEKQLANDPGSVRRRYNLAVAQLQALRSSAALSTLEPLAKSRDPEVLSLLAAAQDSAGHTQTALTTLETALRIAPKDERLYLDAAVLYQKSGLLAPAVKMLDHGFEQIPHSARLLAMRGVMLAELGELDRSEADFERAGSLEPDQTYSAAGLSVLFSETGRAEGAVKLLRGKIAAAPDDPVLNYLLADALLREGAQPGQPEFAEAERALLRAVRIKPDFARARAALGKIYLRAGKAEDAVKELSAALSLDPSNRPALSQLSAALRKAGQTKEAADAAERLRRQYERDLETESTRQRIRLAP